MMLLARLAWRGRILMFGILDGMILDWPDHEINVARPNYAVNVLQKQHI
jgi:hypothetical protein